MGDAHMSREQKYGPIINELLFETPFVAVIVCMFIFIGFTLLVQISPGDFQLGLGIGLMLCGVVLSGIWIVYVVHEAKKTLERIAKVQ